MVTVWMWSGGVDGASEVMSINDSVTDIQSNTSALESANDCSLLSVSGSSLFTSPFSSQSVRPK